jgi:DNA-binding transcriptional LysR family regulator
VTVLERLLLEEPLVALVSAGSRLAQDASIELARLAPYELLTLECDKSHFARRIVAFCKAAGFDARMRETPVAAETLIAMAGAGLGVALAPRSIASITWPGVAVVRIAPDAPRADVYIAHLQTAAAPVHALAEHLLREIPSPGDAP